MRFCDFYFDFGLKCYNQKTSWKNIYSEVDELMSEKTLMLLLKKFIICCEKNRFTHLCAEVVS